MRRIAKHNRITPLLCSKVLEHTYDMTELCNQYEYKIIAKRVNGNRSKGLQQCDFLSVLDFFKQKKNKRKKFTNRQLTQSFVFYFIFFPCYLWFDPASIEIVDRLSLKKTKEKKLLHPMYTHTHTFLQSISSGLQCVHI